MLNPLIYCVYQELRVVVLVKGQYIAEIALLTG